MTDQAPPVLPPPPEDPLRSYWKKLTGVAIFPTVGFVGCGLLRIPPAVMALPFFAVFLYAAWPILTKKVPYSYWGIAMGVWMAGVAVGLILFTLLETAWASH